MKKNKPKVYFLAGAAATGKSSVLNEIRTLMPKGTYFQSSITREFYKSQNIENEIHLQGMSEREKLDFQLKMFDFYIDYTRSKLFPIKVLDSVIDRSIVDYLAYTLYVSPTTMTKDEYNLLTIKVDSFMTELKYAYDIVIVYFGFPTPWANTANTNDGFRFDPFGKNLMISKIIETELSRLCSTSCKFVELRGLYNPDSPISRAKTILES